MEFVLFPFAVNETCSWKWDKQDSQNHDNQIALSKLRKYVTSLSILSACFIFVHACWRSNLEATTPVLRAPFLFQMHVLVVLGEICVG